MTRTRRKLPLILCCLIVIFLFVKKGKQLQQYEHFIPNQEPKAVWDVLADFSNMPHLNTRIQKWELLDESGNYDSWRYRVITYEDMIGGFIFGLNENHGEVLVEPVSPPDHYYHQEVYTTKSLYGLIIIKNYGKMHLRRATEEGVTGTLAKQEVFSDCPLLFHYLCDVEMRLGREEFFKNLANWFSKEQQH
ncbi:uncharacterized protein LOC121860179 [Homarus americanus]|uniref:Uncharacterized protein n=1 Tax=Homarus americanus TaxID=6706 RepID=A0A8J5TK75_HOMAM|nr:uncharacterized protein LOC121860179 [Homarus americanus]KAG7173657.1 hypothetical protein Hamer_G017940 [Homarus americanus]